MNTKFETLSRRSFLKVVTAGSVGFALGCYAPALGRESSTNEALVPNAFVQVDPDGKITITVARSEMGQGVKTSMAMIVAEQMDADWNDVTVVQAPGDGEKYGSQSTWGSQSTLSQYGRLSEMGAAARSMLIAAAAQQWGVSESSCRAESCAVHHDASGRKASYGELASAAAKLQIPEGEIRLKEKSEFKIIGKSKTKVDAPDIVTGKALFTQDVQVPGAVYATLTRCPAFGGKVASFEAAEALAVEGVTDIVEVSNGVAVIATNTWAAMQGKNALKIEWDLGPNGTLDSAEIESRMRSQVAEHPAMPEGSTVVEATYDFPYIAHFTMEPQNAIADVRSDRCEVWAPSQAPDRLQQSIARALDMETSQVIVNVPLLGGGFGRRGGGDFAMEAVEISQKIGKPVKLQWTREDDMQTDGYRPSSHHSLRGAVAGGKPVGWNHQFIKAGGGQNRRAGRASESTTLYSIPGATMMRGSGASSIPTGAWRAVDHGLLEVSDECFYDELAAAAGKDPYEFRRDNLEDERMLNVLNLVAEKAGWGRDLGANRGQGIACFDGYGCRAAHVAEVLVEDGWITVERMVMVVDPGMAINPEGVKEQMEGACMDAIAATLFAKITIKDGGVEQTNVFDYYWPKMADAPKMEIHLIDNTARPGGMGETGFPSAAASVANAVAAATGKRARRFPIVVDELV